MYESFYGLRKPPFDLRADPSHLVLTDTHREALSNLEYGISRQKGIILLTGAAGLGKTTVIRAALRRLSQEVHPVYLNNPGLTRSEFLEALTRRFGLTAAAAASKETLLNELETLLLTRSRQGQASVLIVDEAQSLPVELLEEIRLLANIEAPDRRVFTIVLAGQPQLADKLNDGQLSQLKQRIELRCELRPLTVKETAGYIAWRIQIAGGVAHKLFTRDAVETIHAYAGGTPRTISVLADNALLSAFAMGERPVTRSIVLTVCEDFDLPAPAAQSHDTLDVKPAERSVAAAPDRADATVSVAPRAYRRILGLG
jgi:general secretion pathway protein A